MSERFCLRCDWTGEVAGSDCPRCGVPLYRLGRPEPTTPARPAPSPAPARRPAQAAPAESPRDDGGLPGPAGPEAGRRWTVIALALVVATAGIAFGFVGRTTRDTPAPRGADEGDAGLVFLTPALESPPPSATSGAAASEPGPCPDGLSATIVLQPQPGVEAVVAAAVAADYRFQESLASSVGTAPDLVVVGNGTSGFREEATIGRTVLRFSGGRGLSLPRTAGVVDNDLYTIELLFRFDRLDGYRKIVDFGNGSDDNGLYNLSGCLDFYPRQPAPAAAIARDEYVQVVLTRDTFARVVGYVNGIRQFSFIDAGDLAVIGPDDTLRFFLDDSLTETEYSRGAVSRIRLFDRPLTAGEVAWLACAELRIDPLPDPCR